MTVVRRALVLFTAVAATACAPALLRLAPAPPVADLTVEGLETSLFLIGDAGYAVPGDRVLAALQAQGRTAPRGSAVVFLGDNVYPRGIPPDTAADYPTARDRLSTQAAIADSTGLRVIFVPGNHDWDRHRPTGWAQIQRQEQFLDAYARTRGVSVELQPRGGCPGPVVTRLSPGLRLVAIDTQWWLQKGPRSGYATPAEVAALPDPQVSCPAAREDDVVRALSAVHAEADGSVTVMVGHHPLRSSGEHGGHHPWLQYLFPLVPTPVAGWLWAPIGWIYPLGRKLWADDQDFAGRRNQAMRRAVEGTFQPGSPLLYASGHDHSLELVRHGTDRFFAVSGSGVERHQSAMGRSDSTAFASSRPGFMRLDLFRDGRVRIGVTELDGRNQADEVYQAWLRNESR